jgi:hypothetical protein
MPALKRKNGPRACFTLGNRYQAAFLDPTLLTHDPYLKFNLAEYVDGICYLLPWSAIPVMTRSTSSIVVFFGSISSVTFLPRRRTMMRSTT